MVFSRCLLHTVINLHPDLNLKNLQKTLDRLENSRKAVKLLSASGPYRVCFRGLSGSSGSLTLSAIHRKTGRPALYILNDREEAAYFYDDLTNIDPDGVLFLPSSYKRSIQYFREDQSGIIMRSATLQKTHDAPEGLRVVTYPEAVIEKVSTAKSLENNTRKLRKGDTVSMDQVIGILEEYGFRLTDFVQEPGQYARRGSIIDFFSNSSEQPFRIDFLGDEIQSIRPFRVEDQLSVEPAGEATILPNIPPHAEDPGNQALDMSRTSLFDFFPVETVVWVQDYRFFLDRIGQVFEHTRPGDFSSEHPRQPPKTQFMLNRGDAAKALVNCSLIEFGGQNTLGTDRIIQFHTAPQPAFNKNFDLLGKDLREKREAGYDNYILSGNEKQMERIRSIFEDTGQELSFEPVMQLLHEGFIDHDARICVYTDHQIFDRYHRYRLRDGFTRSESMAIRDIMDLKPGDYVVHVDHGIGLFGGLEKIRTGENVQEAVRLVFRDNDTLYVSIHSLHRISKFKGKDGYAPRIYKLGTGAWEKMKQRTRKKIKDIARELIELYAKRKTREGYRFSADTYLQKELEASFIYEDTPDQWQATRDVKEGMETKHPMDRLVCGDVGFGKTEIAIRAAFKAVADSKQVAVLVPTTILALQHYKTFSRRLEDFPCSVDHVSRIKSRSAQLKTLRKLQDGQIDIIIGTHRLVSRDVRFRDLGLLIVDEEQKFGVRIKEKLKKIKLNVDTLTLTATPIPRTLQLSLMGARDLSVINTPPPNRHPIVTELHTFNEQIIREAILYEVGRNGQVFFIHNRVQNIGEVEKLVKRFCPEVRTAVAHGQLEGPKLERIMLDFIEEKYDVLIATTIIESGLDIPNANTIIINNAQHFGLSDLHQLRGRVGRSNRKAFCYLLGPPLAMISPEARRRLRALEEFSELGSGFSIALQDLDIRGAGNLLGGEQSGFIAEIGLETYHRILDEALQELREHEFSGLYGKEETTETHPSRQHFVTDCQIDTDLELLFPDQYIPNISERLSLYRKLDSLEDEKSLRDFEEQLKDRFGPLPDPSRELLGVVRLRWLAIRAGMEKIVLKSAAMITYFVSGQESPYYQSPVFGKVLKFVRENSRNTRIKESGSRLNLTIRDIRDIKAAILVLEEILDSGTG